MRELDHFKRDKIFDGTEDEFLKKVFELNVEGEMIGFLPQDFYNNPLRNLRNEIPNNDFDRFVSSEKLIKEENFFEDYKSQENLKVYYMIKDNKVFILSFGEFQPARFLIFIESIWKK